MPHMRMGREMRLFQRNCVARCLVATVVSALPISGCGSTVQWPSTTSFEQAESGDALQQLDSTVGDGLSTPLGNGARRQLPTGPSHSQRLDASSQETRNTLSGPDRRNSSGPSSTIPQNSPGVTQREVYIGFGSIEDADKYLKSGGIGSSYGSQQSYARAVIRAINASGGIRGRTIVPVFHDTPTTSLVQNPGAAAQAACEHWTQDKPVFAAISVVEDGAYDSVLTRCLAQRRVVYVGANISPRPNSQFVKLSPYIYVPSGPSLQGLGNVLVKRLVALGYFTGWNPELGRSGSAPTRIGIAYTRRQYGPDYRDSIMSALKRYGYGVAATYEFSGNIDKASQEGAEAVQRFRAAQVTHVFTNYNFTAISVFFESQKYRPRYALQTQNAPRGAEKDSPKSQLAGALGVGWAPNVDVASERDPGDVSAGESRCRKVMHQSGLDTSNRDAFQIMTLTCDAFEFVDSAAEAGDVSPGGLHSGASKLTKFESASTFRASFARGRGNGASVVRDLGWRDDCECVSYFTSMNWPLQ